jgi:hypothetical protein
MRPSHPISAAAGFIGTLLVTALGFAAESDGGRTLETIRRAWVRHAAEWPSVRITWQKSREEPGVGSTYQTAWPDPARDHEVEVDGDHVRLTQPRWFYQPHREYGGFNALETHADPRWLRSQRSEEAMTDFLRALDARFPGASESRRPAEYTLILDENGCKEWWRFPEGRTQEGRVWPSNGLSRHWMLAQLPLLAWLRPLHPQFPLVDWDAAEAVSETEPIAGRPCLKLREDQPDAVRLVWLDAEAGYLPRRILHRNSAAGLVQVDFDYREDSERGWIPAGWTVVLGPSERLAQEYPGRGVLRQFAAFRVENIAAGDGSAGDASADIPAGTWVIDERAGGYFRQKSGGRRGPLSLGDWSRISQRVNEPSRNWAPFVWGAGLAGVAGLAYLAKRQVRNGRSLPRPN